MTLDDGRAIAGSHPGTVEIILRATRLGLFTAAEAGLLIHRVRPHKTTPQLSVRDSDTAGPTGQSGGLSISPDRTLS